MNDQAWTARQLSLIGSLPRRRAGARYAAGVGLSFWLVVGCGEESRTQGDLADGGAADAGGLPMRLVPKPACNANAVAFRQGAAVSLVSELQVAGFNEGFDFTGDGEADNLMAPVGALANSAVKDAFKSGDIFVLLEWFDIDPAGSVVGDDCTKLAVYIGQYQIDEDQDGARSGGTGDRGQNDGDCNDKDPAIHPAAMETDGDRVDNNCDGMTGETDGQDMDGDGASLAAGDCDDRPGMGETIHPGAMEICGDGLDNDCDGIAENGCNPYDDAEPEPIAVDPLSLEASGAPKVVFDNGFIATGTFEAGPSLFSVALPLQDDFDIDFTIHGANMRGTIAFRDGGVYLTDTVLGGVLGARTLDAIKGLEESTINLTIEDSLLDLVFAGFVGKTGIITLAKDPNGHPVPDIDLDGDGLEAFWDSNPDDDQDNVDRCTDGDGTVVEDTPDVPCTMATLPDGTPRFVDGLSVALRLAAVPARLGPLVTPAIRAPRHSGDPRPAQ